MYNKMTIMGRIVNDPELKTTPNGTAVCTFRVAVDRRYQTKGEEKKTDFFNVTAWRTTAEFVAKYFAKGRMILVEGKMQTRPYTDKNGNPATWYEIVADQICFTGEKKDGGSENTNTAPPSPASQQSNRTAHSANNSQPPADNDDYPF